DQNLVGERVHQNPKVCDEIAPAGNFAVPIIRETGGDKDNERESIGVAERRRLVCSDKKKNKKNRGQRKARDCQFVRQIHSGARMVGKSSRWCNRLLQKRRGPGAPVAKSFL